MLQEMQATSSATPQRVDGSVTPLPSGVMPRRMQGGAAAGAPDGAPDGAPPPSSVPRKGEESPMLRETQVTPSATPRRVDRGARPPPPGIMSWLPRRMPAGTEAGAPASAPPPSSVSEKRAESPLAGAPAGTLPSPILTRATAAGAPAGAPSPSSVPEKGAESPLAGAPAGTLPPPSPPLILTRAAAGTARLVPPRATAGTAARWRERVSEFEKWQMFRKMQATSSATPQRVDGSVRPLPFGIMPRRMPAGTAAGAPPPSSVPGKGAESTLLETGTSAPSRPTLSRGRNAWPATQPDS